MGSSVQQASEQHTDSNYMSPTMMANPRNVGHSTDRPSRTPIQDEYYNSTFQKPRGNNYQDYEPDIMSPGRQIHQNHRQEYENVTMGKQRP